MSFYYTKPQWLLVFCYQVLIPFKSIPEPPYIYLKDRTRKVKFPSNSLKATANAEANTDTDCPCNHTHTWVWILVFPQASLLLTARRQGRADLCKLGPTLCAYRVLGQLGLYPKNLFLKMDWKSSSMGKSSPVKCDDLHLIPGTHTLGGELSMCTPWLVYAQPYEQSKYMKMS